MEIFIAGNSIYYKKYQVVEDGIDITTVFLNKITKKLHYNFEALSHEKTQYVEKSNFWIFGCLFFIFLSALVYRNRINHEGVGANAFMIWLSVSLVFLVSYFLTKKTIISIGRRGNEIVWVVTKKRLPKLEQFVSATLKQRTKYLKEKYGMVQKFYSIGGQQAIIKELNQQGILIHGEFQDLDEQLTQLSQDNNRKLDLPQNRDIPIDGNLADYDSLMIKIINRILQFYLPIDESNATIIAESLRADLIPCGYGMWYYRNDEIYSSYDGFGGLKQLQLLNCGDIEGALRIMSYSLKYRIPITMEYSQQLVQVIVTELNKLNFRIHRIYKGGVV